MPGGDDLSLEMGLQHVGVHITGAADGTGVAELLGHGVDDGDNLPFAAGRRIGRWEPCQFTGGQNGAGPGAEILRREMLAGDVLQELVDIV